MALCPEEELNNIEYSGKLMLLFSILTECEACGDKLLVFSQSLFSLDVIEHFLAMIDDNTQNPNPDSKLGNFNGSWTRGIDYFRLDGSTNIETRNANCINFNSEGNPQARFVIFDFILQRKKHFFFQFTPLYSISIMASLFFTRNLLTF